MNKLNVLRFTFLSLVACIGFASCESEDEPVGGSGNEKPTTAYVTYELKQTEDLMSVLQLKAVTTNFDGTSDTVAVNQQSWKRMIKVGIPFSGRVKVLMSKKEGFMPVDKIYKLGLGGATGFRYSDDTSESTSLSISTVDVSSQNIEAYIDKYILRTHEWSVEVK